jgi:cellulose synthase/poly-beta-1,6-N-acetylglucosamine synthase-like glycosyltransferase
LDQCLRALSQLAYPHFQVLVVDNAPSDTRAVSVARRWGARYLVEPVAGLSRARNTGARACTSAVVAFTDDDAVPGPAWLSELAAPFRDPNVAVVTGRTLPAMQDGVPAVHAEMTDLGPETIHLDRRHPLWFEMASFGGIGNGNNMAFRRDVFDGWAGFDERLGRGAPLSSCEEHRAFGDLVEAGYTVVYAPRAVVHHPVPHTVGERREQYVRSRSDLVAYATLLFIDGRHRWKVTRYVVEAALGTRRTWRFRTGVPPLGVSRWRLMQAYAAGVWTCLWREIRPGSRSPAIPANQERRSSTGLRSVGPVG